MKKGIHIFSCASQSSTSTLAAAPGAGGAGGGRGPAIDRYNPIIHDHTRLRLRLLNNPPQSQFQNNADAPHDDYNISSNIDKEVPKKKKPGKKQEEKSRSIMNGNEEDDDNYATIRSRRSISDSSISIMKNWKIKGRRSWSCINPGAFITPPAAASSGSGSSSSSRFLLTENTLLDNLEPGCPDKSIDDSLVSSAPVPFQVVVLRVSLHCRGCEKKLRKHISTMQGVSSYNIEFAAKKVTVEGNVTPLGVLASISKVKNAQLWFPLLDVPAPAQTVIPSSSLML